MSKSLKRLVVIEGIDGSGKSTVVKALVAKLDIDPKFDGEVLDTCEPTKNPIGKLIRETYLSGNEKISPKAMVKLFTADRIDHLERMGFINTPHDTEDNTIWISDRYTPSTVVYNIGSESVKDVVREAVLPLPKPKYMIYLKVSEECASGRMSKSDNHNEIFDDPSLLKKNKKNYEILFRNHAKDIAENIIVIDGEQPVEAIVKEIMDKIDFYSLVK